MREWVTLRETDSQRGEEDHLLHGARGGGEGEAQLPDQGRGARGDRAHLHPDPAPGRSGSYRCIMGKNRNVTPGARKISMV